MIKERNKIREINNIKKINKKIKAHKQDTNRFVTDYIILNQGNIPERLVKNERR